MLKINSLDISKYKNYNYTGRIIKTSEVEKRANLAKDKILDEAQGIIFEAKDTFNKWVYFAYGSDFSIKPLDKTKYNLTKLAPYRYEIETKFDKGARTFISYNPKYLSGDTKIVEEYGLRQNANNYTKKSYMFQNDKLDRYIELNTDKKTGDIKQKTFIFKNGELSNYIEEKYNKKLNETSHNAMAFYNNKMIGFGFEVNRGNRIK